MKEFGQQSSNTIIKSDPSPEEETDTRMRPGSRWNGESANPITAAIYGAVISVVVAYGLSYFLERIGMGVITAPTTWKSSHAFMLAALNLYASQHVPLIGSGVLPDEMGRIHVNINFPLMIWAIVPALGLMLGGWRAARIRSASGRWGMIAPAIAGGIIYVAILAGCAEAISAKFTSTAIPSIQGIEFNPPDIPFHPSLTGTLIYASVFALIFTYLGSLIALRGQSEPAIPGKWWACAKSVVIISLVIQLLLAGGLLAWFTTYSRTHDVEESAQMKFAQILPTAAGIGYAVIPGARLSGSVLPVDFPSAAYNVNVGLYHDVIVNAGGKITHKPLGHYIWIAALLGAMAAFISGRWAVKLGSRDGSLPTALRITILQALYLWIIMLLCNIGWGIAGQSSVSIRLLYSSELLIATGCVFVLSMIGAHWANVRYAGRLSGFPNV